MNQYEVVKILGKPEEMKLRLDHTIVNYWGVPVVLRRDDKEHESTVTFETFVKASKLEVGEVFYR